jgi:hypothetical protein
LGVTEDDVDTSESLVDTVESNDNNDEDDDDEDDDELDEPSDSSLDSQPSVDSDQFTNYLHIASDGNYHGRKPRPCVRVWQTPFKQQTARGVLRLPGVTASREKSTGIKPGKGRRHGGYGIG